ncbi:MAG: carbamoyl-phosphate synthase large subunit [Verrucomicrobia bacterium]|nr:carbamoyl-phosphate synthase large subunit [Kiritimatiellia bacterium]MCP5488771.1 carbamoyl-phosphate synthase large subunit [Verrucomicrobiota bacterium]
MPKRTDIQSILIIGSGPIVIGQACEFDYSGTQACKALREEGYRVILVNSNPATIMTDPETADRTYVEPITPQVIEKILAKERPDVILPTLGGQTALNTALKVADLGILDKYGVELIGAKAEVIRRAEDRILFKEAMEAAGIPCLRSSLIRSIDEARDAAEAMEFPIIVRPSYTLGGTGGGTAHDLDELIEITSGGLKASLNSTCLLEESVLGWKEFELEVMRDHQDNCVIICSIENVDPMGIHTGDSITVAPIQTLTDREYQVMRDAAIKVLRVIGVETGGSNVQFALHPQTGRMVVIEMNPRVSRSSALASKATGFPIAKIAAKLAVGYTLDELSNDITRETPACFEPTLDYCVVKIPRFAFEKFPGAKPILGVSMKSVGETMAIGTNFREAYQKALRGLEISVDGYDLKFEKPALAYADLDAELRKPSVDRHRTIKVALKKGYSIDRLAELTGMDPWFLDNFLQIVELEKELVDAPALTLELLRTAKRSGFSDKQIAALRGADVTEADIRALRTQHGIVPVYRLVDTCAAEFEAYTPYFYSSYQAMDQARVTDKRKIMVLGSGPNRIGQGIEFDYCCVHTVFALRELGYETIMVNSNPETVSTDYDTSDKLFFEPLTFEDVMNIYEREKPEGVVVQMGGQTPLNLAVPLMAAGVPILGTSSDSIDIAEDRKRCRELLERLGIKQAESGTATTLEEAKVIAERIGFPVMVRPSYVLGGRAMMVANNPEELEPFVQAAFEASPGFPVLLDRYLDRAIEVDVDVLGDGEQAHIGGVMQHVEQAGIHSGDSACATPPHSLPESVVEKIKQDCLRLALELKVKGLMNIQMAVKDNEVYVIELNPRASRTVPFISKATGVPLAKLAAKISAGVKLADLDTTIKQKFPQWCAVKEAVFPFNRFSGVDPILGPEMKSTGEVMGIDTCFELAYWKSQIAAGQILPQRGRVFLSARNADKDWMVDIGHQLHALGFSLIATEGTARVLQDAGLTAQLVHKLAEKKAPNVLDFMKKGEVHLVINTPSGALARGDEVMIRSEAILRSIPIVTTRDGAMATLSALHHMIDRDWTVHALQDFYA